MRQQIYLEDSYLKDLESTVTETGEHGVKFEQTIFYPRGGGQPADRGRVTVSGTDYEVEKITSLEDGTWVSMKGEHGLEVGDTAVQHVDWDYRYKLMQHHTILHLLSAVVWDKYRAKVTGGTIYHNKARLDFDLDDFSNELAQELVDQLNSIIDQHHEVEISFVDRKTAESDPELIRTKVNLLPDFIEEIRLVKIGNVDVQADGGLHVNSTRELNHVELVKTENKGKGRKRISVAMTT